MVSIANALQLQSFPSLVIAQVLRGHLNHEEFLQDFIWTSLSLEDNRGATPPVRNTETAHQYQLKLHQQHQQQQQQQGQQSQVQMDTKQQSAVMTKHHKNMLLMLDKTSWQIN